MHEIVVVDCMGQRLRTYSVGDKQGIHPAHKIHKSQRTFLCCINAQSALCSHERLLSAFPKLSVLCTCTRKRLFPSFQHFAKLGGKEPRPREPFNSQLAIAYLSMSPTTITPKHGMFVNLKCFCSTLFCSIMLKFRRSSIEGSDWPPVSHPSFPAYMTHNMSQKIVEHVSCSLDCYRSLWFKPCKLEEMKQNKARGRLCIKSQAGY